MYSWCSMFPGSVYNVVNSANGTWEICWHGQKRISGRVWMWQGCSHGLKWMLLSYYRGSTVCLWGHSLFPILSKGQVRSVQLLDVKIQTRVKVKYYLTVWCLPEKSPETVMTHTIPFEIMLFYKDFWVKMSLIVLSLVIYK